MNKLFWALPATVSLSQCALAQVQQAFSVHNDLLANPQYEIIFSESYVPTSDAESTVAEFYETERRRRLLQQDKHQVDQDEEAETRTGLELMMFNERPYLCSIPYPEPPAAQNATASSHDEQQQELARASDRGRELLKGMQGDCIYYGAGWWFYSFCYNKYIKQFHPLPPSREVPHYLPVEDKTVASYVLGRFENKKKDGKAVNKGVDGPSDDKSDESPKGNSVDVSPPQLQTRGETNFLVQWLGGGTVCDLTGRERRIEVQFHCNPTKPDHINMIKETSSCVYMMVIHTPRLCDDVAFLPPQTVRPSPITCQEIVDEHEVADWKAAKTQQVKSLMQEVEKEAAALLLQAARPVVGGIEVGAQKYVGGSPERKIKPSEAVQRAQRAAGELAGGTNEDPEDEHIATIAKSDGQYTTTLNEKELKKKGISSSKKDLDKLVKQMNEKAGEGTAWRLEVIRSPDGFSYKGVIEEKAGGKEKEKESSSDSEEGSQEEMKKK